MSASVNLLLHHKVQSSLLAPAHPGGPGKRAIRVVVVVVATHQLQYFPVAVCQTVHGKATTS